MGSWYRWTSLLVICASLLLATMATTWAQEASPVASDSTPPGAGETVEAAAEPSPTATEALPPAITINGSSEPVVYLSSTDEVIITRQNILQVLFYKNGDCSGNSAGNWYGEDLTLTDSATSYIEWAGGTTFSLQGFNEDGGAPVITCRTVIFDAAPTPTVVATPILTVNGSTDPVVYVDPASDIAITYGNMPALLFFRGSSCEGANDGYWTGEPYTRTDQATAWQSWANGYTFSMRGSTDVTGSGEALTDCRVVVIGEEPPATSTPTTTATATATNTPTLTPPATTPPTEIVTATAVHSATSPVTELPNTGTGAISDRSWRLVGVAMAAAMILYGFGIRLRRR